MIRMMAHETTERPLTSAERDIVKSALLVYHSDCLKRLAQAKWLDGRMAGIARTNWGARADATARLVNDLDTLNAQYPSGIKLVVRW